MSQHDDHIRPGFQSITPYLIVDGAARLIEFLETAFDAVEDQSDRTPGPDGTIAHAAVRIAGIAVEISDGRPEFPPRPAGLHLYVADVDATYQRALAAGGSSIHPPTDMPYGERGAGIEDPSGNHWYLATWGKTGA